MVKLVGRNYQARHEGAMQERIDERKTYAISMFADFLESLRAERPSVRLAADRSAKGGQTVAAILKATRAVFVREGHAGLTMRMVAEEAGIVVGNISYYFQTKRELLEAMLREELADYVEAHVKQFEPDGQDPMEILLNVVEFYVQNGRSSYRFFYQMWGYAGSENYARELVRDLYRPIGRFIYRLVKAANPSLDHTQIRRIVLQIFCLEEGMKLFIGMGPDDDVALLNAEADIRDLTRRIVESG